MTGTPAAPGGAPDSGAGGSPYVGPRAFRPGEALHGRVRETRDLTELLAAERIVLCHSPSGAGKTSLIQARLVPALEARFVVRGPVRVSDPASVGVEGANRYVLSVLLGMESARAEEADRLPVGELARLTLDEYLALRAEPSDRPGPDGEAPPPRPEVLIFDQFEEILTLAPYETRERTEFFAQVGAALRAPRRRALFAIREEYVAALDPYVHLIPTRLSVRYALELLDAEGAADAIAEPAKAAGVPFTPAALATLVDNLRRAPLPGSAEGELGRYVEPVQLQVVCTRIWRRLPEGATRIEAVGGVGDVDTALAEYYAETVARVAGEHHVPERRIRRWFDTALVAGGVRAQVARGGEAAYGLNESTVRSLVDAYLVRREERRTSLWYELAHDRLIVPVRNDNARWFAEHAGHLQRQAESWAAGGRPEGMLFRGGALKQARRWADENGDDLTPEIEAFLAASALAQRIGQRKTVFFLSGLVTALVLALGYALWKYVELRNEMRVTRSIAAQLGVSANELRQGAFATSLSQTVDKAVAADSALDVSRARGDSIQPDVSVWYFTKAADPDLATLLTEQGFAVRAMGGRNLIPTNAILYGDSVNAGTIRLLAYGLLRANVPIVAICKLQNRDRHHVAQVLGAANPGGVPKVTLEQVAAITDTARSVNCPADAPRRTLVYLQFYGGGDEAADRERVREVQRALIAAGFNAPGVDSVSVRSNSVRYTVPEDRALAESVGRLTARTLGWPDGSIPARVSRVRMPAGRLEVWLDLTAPPVPAARS